MNPNIDKCDELLEEEIDSDFGEFNEVRERIVAKLGGRDRYLPKYLPKVGSTYKVHVDGYGKYANYDTFEYTLTDASIAAEKEFWKIHGYNVDLEIVSLIPNNSYAVPIGERIEEAIDDAIQELAKRAAWFRGSEWLKANAHHLEVPNSGNAIGVDLEGRVTVNGSAVEGTDIRENASLNIRLVQSFVEAKAVRKAEARVASDAEAAKNLIAAQSAWEVSKQRLANLKKQVEDLGFEVAERGFAYVVIGYHRYRPQNKGTKFRTITDPELLHFAEIKGLKTSSRKSIRPSPQSMWRDKPHRR
jgi:hypothetical protein